MSAKYAIKYCLLLWCCIAVSVQYNTTFAQKAADTASKSQIIILENEYVEYINQDTLTIQRLVGNVKLLHDSDTIYCDSAVVIKKLNTAEAYGDVLVLQADGTEALADYMRYTGNNKTVYMRGDVQLQDNKGNELWGNEVTYNLRTKVGEYHNKGTLVSEQTMVSSKHATYNMKTKDARFQGNVVVNDPEYYVVSRDLGYNTDTKIAKFFGPSIVTNENSMLQTSNGFYATGEKTSKFWSRTSILNDGQYIEADTLFYTKSTGWAHAYGNVIIIDTAQHNSTMYSEYAEYNELTKKMLAYKEPVVKFITEDDVYYYRSDTFFSEPVVIEPEILTAQDSMQKSIDEIQNAIIKQEHEEGEVGTAGDFSIDELLGVVEDSTGVFTNIELKDTVRYTLSQVDVIATKGDVTGRHRNRKDVDAQQAALNTARTADTTEISGGGSSPFVMNDSLSADNQTFYNYATGEDTTNKRYFLGYHHVRIYSDSLQGVCDSMKYNQLDSLVTLYNKPLLWSGNNQMKGEVITMLMDSSEMKEITIPKNGIVIARSGPEKAGFFDQIQGNYIKGYLSKGKIDSLIAERDAMNIYFMKDENDYYSGVNESKSDRIEAVFVKEEIEKISYRGPTDGVTTPMTEINPEALRLSRFFWHTEERITTLEEFLGGKRLQDPQLFRWGTKE